MNKHYSPPARPAARYKCPGRATRCNVPVGQAAEAHMLAIRIAVIAALTAASAAAQNSQPTGPEYGPLTSMLLSQPLAQTRTELERRISDAGGDDNVRLALGLARLLQSVERLGQSLYRYG